MLYITDLKSFPLYKIEAMLKSSFNGVQICSKVVIMLCQFIDHIKTRGYKQRILTTPFDVIYLLLK